MIHPRNQGDTLLKVDRGGRHECHISKTEICELVFQLHGLPVLNIGGSEQLIRLP
jgi:hypothetical protein